jgi:NADPH:quinone reductase-like Zn-dependent oxidoreductase
MSSAIVIRQAGGPEVLKWGRSRADHSGPLRRRRHRPAAVPVIQGLGGDRDRHRLEVCASDPFNEVVSGRLRVNVSQRFALRDATLAHQALVSRATTGATVLVP